MDKKKKVIIIVAIISAIVICIAIIGVILFTKTELFRTKQEMFAKYLGQNIEIIEQYMQDSNKTKMEQLKNNPHTVNSNIKLDLESSDPEIANQTTPPRNFNISYNKNADPQNNRDYSEVKIRYLTKELFTGQYAHDGDLHMINGINNITSEPIFNMYLGIENNNLKQLARKLGIQDVSNIPNKIENISIMDLLNLSEEEKAQIQSLLVRAINSQISQDKYYYNKNIKIEAYEKQLTTNIYGIELTNEEYKNVVIEILNEILKDESVLNIILHKAEIFNLQTNITTSDIQRYIQNQIEEINAENFKNGLKIEFYESNGKLVRTRNRDRG